MLKVDSLEFKRKHESKILKEKDVRSIEQGYLHANFPDDQPDYKGISNCIFEGRRNTKKQALFFRSHEHGTYSHFFFSNYMEFYAST